MHRKYKKQVNQNGWMVKIQRFVFTDPPKFVGYCPFFWFTWLCLFLVPVVAVFRVVTFPIRLAAKAFGSAKSKVVRRPSDKVLGLLYEMRVIYGIEDWVDVDSEGVAEWIAATPDWMNCAKRAYLSIKAKEEREAIRAPKRAARAARISKYSAYIVKPILALLMLAATAIVGFVLWNLASNMTWEILKDVGIVLLVLVVVFTVAVIAVELISAVINRFRKCPKCPEKMTLMWKLGDAVGAGIEFIAETVESIYKRECPLIEWADESTPIERMGR